MVFTAISHAVARTAACHTRLAALCCLAAAVGGPEAALSQALGRPLSSIRVPRGVVVDGPPAWLDDKQFLVPVRWKQSRGIVLYPGGRVVARWAVKPEQSAVSARFRSATRAPMIAGRRVYFGVNDSIQSMDRRAAASTGTRIPRRVVFDLSADTIRRIQQRTSWVHWSWSAYGDDVAVCAIGENGAVCLYRGPTCLSGERISAMSEGLRAVLVHDRGSLRAEVWHVDPVRNRVDWVHQIADPTPDDQLALDSVSWCEQTKESIATVALDTALDGQQTSLVNAKGPTVVSRRQPARGSGPKVDYGVAVSGGALLLMGHRVGYWEAATMRTRGSAWPESVDFVAVAPTGRRAVLVQSSSRGSTQSLVVVSTRHRR